MVERVKPDAAKGGGLYFPPKSDLQYIGTGCSALNLVISGRVDGGYVGGRMSNMIGDKSTGKTLLAIEATANAHKKYPWAKIKYCEAESAFDEAYAESLGMPIEAVDFGDERVETVEDFEEDLRTFCKEARKVKKDAPSLYILDSMDALSDRAEMERKMGEASYGTGKAKQNSQMFRKLVREIEDANVHLMIISQVRDNIGAMFGDKTTRSGGRALDFYSSQTVKLAHLKTIVSTKSGIKRATGIRIKAKCTKNKVSVALRECEFVIRFGFGIENYEAGMEWILENKRQKDLGLSIEAAKAKIDDSYDWDADKYNEEMALLDEALQKGWNAIETEFAPHRRKYE